MLQHDPRDYLDDYHVSWMPYSPHLAVSLIEKKKNQVLNLIILFVGWIVMMEVGPALFDERIHLETGSTDKA